MKSPTAVAVLAVNWRGHVLSQENLGCLGVPWARLTAKELLDPPEGARRVVSEAGQVVSEAWLVPIHVARSQTQVTQGYVALSSFRGRSSAWVHPADVLGGPQGDFGRALLKRVISHVAPGLPSLREAGKRAAGLLAERACCDDGPKQEVEQIGGMAVYREMAGVRLYKTRCPTCMRERSRVTLRGIGHVSGVGRYG